jgi:hypothetical protein
MGSRVVLSDDRSDAPGLCDRHDRGRIDRRTREARILNNGLVTREWSHFESPSDFAGMAPGHLRIDLVWAHPTRPHSVYVRSSSLGDAPPLRGGPGNTPATIFPSPPCAAAARHALPPVQTCYGYSAYSARSAISASGRPDGDHAGYAVASRHPRQPPCRRAPWLPHSSCRLRRNDRLGSPSSERTCLAA